MKTEQKKWNDKTGWVSISKNNLNKTAQLVFLFGERNLLKDKKYLEEIKDFYPQAHILGCSTAGEIIGTQVLDNSLVATAVLFEDTNLQFANIEMKNMEGSFEAGKQLAESLEREGLVHVFVLSDGLNINGTGLAKGLLSGLPENVAVTGGLAGDQSRFEETIVISDCNLSKNSIAVIGFYGNHLKIGYGSVGGWDSFGRDRLITRSKENILYELDGQPALELYKKYLGDQAEGLPSTGLLFPLSIRPQGEEVNLVRTILAVDEKDGSMTFAGDVPEGSSARLMKANFERLIEGASDAASMTTVLSKPDLAILISCVGRKLVLKQRVEEEVEGVQAILGNNTTMTGFYSYGEICPVVPTEKQCQLHNQTMTITTFSE